MRTEGEASVLCSLFNVSAGGAAATTTRHKQETSHISQTTLKLNPHATWTHALQLQYTTHYTTVQYS